MEQQQSFKMPDTAGAKKRSPVLSRYESLKYTDIRQEMDRIRVMSELNSKEWQREVTIYEQTRDGKPRRNYANRDCTVADTDLYPYHDACYPLIGAYENEMLIHTADIHPVVGSLPCVHADIEATISGLSVGLELSEIPSLYPVLVDEWSHGIDNRMKTVDDPDFCKRPSEADVEFARENGFGLACFPTDDEARGDILLKLLRHAMSDLQCDHILAGEVLVRMSRWKLLQNVKYLRRVLCVIVSGIKECQGGLCYRFEEFDEEEADHSCFHWTYFRKKLAVMLTTGIDYFTDEHALLITGIIHMHFDDLNPSAARLEESLIEKVLNPEKRLQSASDKLRMQVQKKVFMSKNTYHGYEEDSSDDDDDDDDGEEDDDVEEEGEFDDTDETRQEFWTDDIVAGLAAHAILARQRIGELRDTLSRQTVPPANHKVHVEMLRNSIDSFHNCTRCLVSVGEIALRRLPSNPLTVGFVSRLVLYLSRLFVEPSLCIFDHERFDVRTYAKAGLSAIDPNRYADSILNATKNYRQYHFPQSSKGSDSDSTTIAAAEADDLLREKPHRDVQDLVWCCFAKGLVDVMVSRCGYGDIQVWWGIPVTPLDPLLFNDEYNIPIDDVIENAWDVGSGEERIAWETDENGKELWKDVLSARYDFSLLLFLCAWQAPWTPERHHSFQKPFRRAATTLFLCANRIQMPLDIVSHVCSYLRRDWWPDERRQCFESDCYEKSAGKLLQKRVLSSVAGKENVVRIHKSCVPCPRCGVAFFCCEEHRNSGSDLHRDFCKLPPCRIPGVKERELFVDLMLWFQEEGRSLEAPILNEQVKCLVESLIVHVEAEVQEDDSGDWESVDSEDDRDNDEEEAKSFTSVVHKFFERECYRLQRNRDDDDDDDDDDDE